MDSQTFAQLYTRWLPALEREAERWLSRACRAEAPDVVSDVYLAMSSRLGMLDADPGNAYTYCLRLVRWRAVDRRRHLTQTRHAQMCSLEAMAGAASLIAAPGQSVEDQVIGAEATQRIVDTALAACKTPQQRLVLAVLVSGINNHYHYGARGALASRLGMGDDALKQAIYRVRENVRAALPDDTRVPPRRRGGRVHRPAATTPATPATPAMAAATA